MSNKSDFKRKMLETSGEISPHEELNEDHKILSRNASLEARLHEAFAKIMNDIQCFEYSLSGYSALPYGKSDPDKVIEQANNNKEMLKKLKELSYQRMGELKQVIDEVFCPPGEYKEKKEYGYKDKDYSYGDDYGGTSQETEIPVQSPESELEVSIGTTEDEGEPYYAKKYAKKTKKKKKKHNESKKLSNSAKAILEISLKE